MVRSKLGVSAASVSLVVALASACTSASAPTASGFAGYRWNVVQIHGPRRDVPIPTDSTAPVFVAFSRNGRLDAADAMERFHQLHYALVPGGYRVTGYRGSFGWYADKAEERVALALASVLDGDVRASVEKHRLHLAGDSYELVCVRVGGA